MAVEVAAARRRFTRAEYHRMVEVGILTDGERVELICGEIIKKLTQGRRHRAFVDNLNQILVPRLAGRAIVSIQMPIVARRTTPSRSPTCRSSVGARCLTRNARAMRAMRSWSSRWRRARSPTIARRS